MYTQHVYWSLVYWCMIRGMNDWNESDSQLLRSTVPVQSTLALYVCYMNTNSFVRFFFVFLPPSSLSFSSNFFFSLSFFRFSVFELLVYSTHNSPVSISIFFRFQFEYFPCSLIPIYHSPSQIHMQIEYWTWAIIFKCLNTSELVSYSCVL